MEEPVHLHRRGGEEEVLGDFKAGRSFEPTPSAAEASGTAATSKKAVAVPAAKKPAEIKVTIRNGAGISGLAKQASLILKAKGFAVGETGNANQNVYKQTLVVYKTDKAAAELVASGLMPGHEGRGGPRYVLVPDRDLVVVGKDWDTNKIPVAQVSTN